MLSTGRISAAANHSTNSCKLHSSPDRVFRKAVETHTASFREAIRASDGATNLFHSEIIPVTYQIDVRILYISPTTHVTSDVTCTTLLSLMFHLLVFCMLTPQI